MKNTNESYMIYYKCRRKGYTYVAYPFLLIKQQILVVCNCPNISNSKLITMGNALIK